MQSRPLDVTLMRRRGVGRRLRPQKINHFCQNTLWIDYNLHVRSPIDARESENVFTTCPICRSKPNSAMTPTIRPGPLRSNSRSVISPHARGQEASLADRKRGGRVQKTEQAQQGWQRLGDLNIDLTIDRERISMRLSDQKTSAPRATPPCETLHAVL